MTTSGRHFHFMGIGGQGISSVAQMSLLQGDRVSGCEYRPSAATEALSKKGIKVFTGHSPTHLDGVDVLVLSPAITAVNKANPEVGVARERGIPVIIWQELLGEFMAGKYGISVAGVHGKGTTTAMLSLLLVDAGKDPTCEVGAIVPRFGANYRLGSGNYFINEADEFNYNFLHYHPNLVVLTALEYEHPETYPDYATFLSGFERFIRGMASPATLVVNADSPGCLELVHQRLSDWNGAILTFGLNARATVQATNVQLEGETSFSVVWNGTAASVLPDWKRVQLHPLSTVQAGQVLGKFNLLLPGRHNVENALGAITAALVVGVEPQTMPETLATFAGILRRFEIKASLSGITLIDDYAHHPTAIAATLQAVRQRFGERRLVAVYQPHMFSRVKTFFTEFIAAFDLADLVLLSDIFPAREVDTGLIHSLDLVKGVQSRPVFQGRQGHVRYADTVEAVTGELKSIIQPGDVVLVMGAGDIYKVTEHIQGWLEERHHETVGTQLAHCAGNGEESVEKG